jgi:ketosteroid isomerase-like protein
VADQDTKPAKADLARVPGLLDQYRQQRRAWLEQADELVRMRNEVRQAAEREAIEIVTAARRDVRRIIVEARRELLVLTAQLHAAVEATDISGLEAPPFTALLADPDARSRAENASHDGDLTSDVVHEARKGVRSVLDEARAEIEALSAEAPQILAHAGSPDMPLADLDDEPRAASNRDDSRSQDSVNEGPIHELSLDASLAALEFQTRDLPIPTLARLLGTEPGPDGAQNDDPAVSVYEPPAYNTPRLSELRSLLRDSVDALDPVAAPEPRPSRSAISSGLEPLPASPFFAAPDTAAAADSTTDGPDGRDETDPPQFTPPSRLFGEDEAPSSTRSARTFVGLFAATGAAAVVGTLWWALTRDSAPLSAAAPPVITEKTSAAPPVTPAAPAVAATAPGTLALTIEARRPSWIRALVDGKDETGRIYQAGETRHIYGARTVSIRAGDAGAVFVGMDGGTAQALGADGQAVTKRYSAAAAAPPAVANAVSTPATPLPDVAGAVPAVATSRPAPPETTAATASPQAAPAAADTAAASGSRPDLVQAAQQWLDAYQRRDREAMTAMGTENVTVSDERSVTERFPAWQGGVQRNLDEVALELTGDVAVFTARMTERADAAGAQHVSRVSQFWQRRGTRWYVTNVRIIGEARLNQIIK